MLKISNQGPQNESSSSGRHFHIRMEKTWTDLSDMCSKPLFLPWLLPPNIYNGVPVNVPIRPILGLFDHGIIKHQITWLSPLFHGHKVFKVGIPHGKKTKNMFLQGCSHGEVQYHSPMVFLHWENGYLQ